MTITATEAYEAMPTHHRTLTGELTARADAVSSAVAAGQSHGTAVTMLIAYLARVTAALHGLARRAGAENGGGLAGGGVPESAAAVPAAGPNLDVRDLAPALRHETIFGAYRALRPGTGFVLVNDHDPKPLRYQSETHHQDEYTWDYLDAGPKVRRVRIGRAGL